MKTPMPEPAIPRSQLLATSQGVFGMLFTEEQLRAAMVAAYNEGIEDAAKVCSKEAKGFIEYNLAQSAHGCNCCADTIRKLGEKHD